MINFDKLHKSIQREIFKRSYYEFYKIAFAQLHPGSEYDENWHAKYLCDRLQEEAERIWRGERRKKDIIINMPFRASKSMITTIIFPAWCWAYHPEMKFITVSYSSDLAVEHSQRTKDLINSNWYQYLWGDKVIFNPAVNAKGHYETISTGMRKAVGTGGQITGSGADIIILDDPQNPKKAASEVERESAKNFYDHTLFSRLNDPAVGVRIVVMQRLHEEDVTGHLMEVRPDSHEHICIPGELDLEMLSPPELQEHYIDGLFWATRFNKQELAAYKKALGDLQFAGQIGQRPAPAEGNLLKREWFEILKPEEVVRNSFSEPIHFILDTAYTEKQENDPSGILACFKRDGVIYVMNIAEVWKKFPDLVTFVKDYAMLNDYSNKSLIYVEPKASGKSLVQQIRKETHFNIVEIESDMLRDDKMTRVSTISPSCQAGKVKLIKGAWNDKFLTQITTFPNAKHDEFVDCICYACDRLLINDSMSWGFL